GIVKLCVVSAGAWGTALAIAFAGSGQHRVALWAREAEVLADMRQARENRRFLPGHRLPDELLIADDFSAAVADAELLVLATPLAGLRPTLRRLAAEGLVKPLVWVSKGLEAGSGKLPHAIAAEELGAAARYGALSGPSFAEEVARGLPTAVTLAANDA